MPRRPTQSASRGIVLPGMVDLHSHAFQRALAGLTQRLGADAASFWSWRDTMYAFAQQITPEDERAIAAQLYVELLKGGYTTVVEFHYLHHQPDGSPYAERAAMSLALHEAALEAGIALTLLPVVYMQAGVDGSPLAGAQRRFALDPDGWARLTGELDRVFADAPDRQLGLALHSVRAVPTRRSPPPWRSAAVAAGASCRSTSIWPSSPRRSATASTSSVAGRWPCSTPRRRSTRAGASSMGPI